MQSLPTSITTSRSLTIRGQTRSRGVGTKATTTSAPLTSNPVVTSAPTTTTTTSAQTRPATTTSASSTTAAASSTTAASTSSTSTPTTATSSSSSPSSTEVVTSASVSTDAQGVQTTVIVTNTPSPASATASPSSTSTSQDSSVRPGTIIGLSVAGGIAALAIIGFIIWKLTRKRFADLDTDEAIKWPELNREHTTNDEGLSRQPSNPYSTSAASRNASTLDQTEFSDPYAVPPLPQFNPNQPYRDDPYAASNSGYYDPYRGPIPQTFHEGSVDGHENIPMSTYPPGARGRSPGPGAVYDMGGRGSPAPGRASPALGPIGYDAGGRGSPAPGRTISPGPAAALGLDRRPTPGVQNAYGGPPEMAVRNRSPGPNVLG
ncbi:hypothetical protein JB92DRAFT_1988354 [Gautieria morchelliformis]|nr:hypothetical protein JB92DRAFT_1988354 [Gautieria morchelliformis]